jgi:hypothetical protein
MVTRHDYGKSEVEACLSVLVKIIKPFKSNKLVCEGLGKIRAKFKNINAHGPVWLVNFEDVDDEEEMERLKRDAYERVNAFLDALGIDEFKEE